jgi:hypothetical protein
MAAPTLTSEQIAQVSGLVAQFIAAQRLRFLHRGKALTKAQKAVMNGFFTPQLLDGARLLVLQGGRVANPTFYPMLMGIGFCNLPDFSQSPAVTFFDVVVSHVALTDAVLFHELVHVEQYRQFSIPRFSQLYVRGFLSGGGHDGIPLELNASNLTARFEAKRQQRFSVAEEVKRLIHDDKVSVHQ